MSYPVVVLKAGREIPLLAGHPWVFSRGIEQAEITQPGAIVEVRSWKGDFLGLGTYHPSNTIRIRLLTRNLELIDTEFFFERFIRLRSEKERFLPPHTDGFRLVHADADGLPGLIVDVYGEVAVFQIHTAGIEPFRELVAEALSRLPKIRAVVERSDVEARKAEGLSILNPAVHRGNIDGPVPFQEAGLTLLSDVLEGQKTGFFLDQREARDLVRETACNRKVWNLFSYTCSFGMAALKGGACEVVNVDSSRSALELGEHIFRQNGVDLQTRKVSLKEADVFTFLEEAGREPKTDISYIICDPPAFAKTRANLEAARKAYLRLNTLCFRQLQQGGLFLTSSCSGMLGLEDFLSILRIAAGHAGKQARILRILGQAADHTRNLAFPEGSYLKTVLLEVRE